MALTTNNSPNTPENSMKKGEQNEAVKSDEKMMRVYIAEPIAIAGSFGTRRVEHGGGWIEVPEKVGKGLIEGGVAFKDAPKNPAQDN